MSSGKPSPNGKPKQNRSKTCPRKSRSNGGREIMRGLRSLPLLTGAFLLLGAPAFLRAQQAPYSGQVRIARGQDVTPAFEGWVRNPDGTISMYFGYMNRNYEEELDISIGADNQVELAGDSGGD